MMLEANTSKAFEIASKQTVKVLFTVKQIVHQVALTFQTLKGDENCVSSLPTNLMECTLCIYIPKQFLLLFLKNKRKRYGQAGFRTKDHSIHSQLATEFFCEYFLESQNRLKTANYFVCFFTYVYFLAVNTHCLLSIQMTLPVRTFKANA